VAAHFRHCPRGGFEISPDEIAPLLGIELRGNAGRAYKIAEHHREITPLANGFRRGFRRRDRRLLAMVRGAFGF
jgi:hypothetical protein